MIRQIMAPISAKLNIRQHPLVQQYLTSLLVMVVLFGALAFFDIQLNKKIPEVGIMPHFLILGSLALLFGILLCWLFEKKLFQDFALAQRSGLLVLTVILGILLFAFISLKGEREIPAVYLRVYIPTLILMLLPWVFRHTLLALVSVPLLRFRPYVFESLQDAIATINFGVDKTRGIRWIFEDDFTEVDPSGCYSFKLLNPPPDILQAVSLAHLFKATFAEHNIARCPNEPIQFESEDKFYGWVFYDYPHRFRPELKRYLDPSKSIKELRLPLRRASKVVRASTIYVTRLK